MIKIKNLANAILVDMVPITFQAESYLASQGVQTESTWDVGGGLNVGYIDATDWMAYDVTIPSTGLYNVEYRVAGSGSLRLEKLGGSAVYGTISIPYTGGYQKWITVSHTVYLNAGTISLAIAAITSGWNLNWFRISTGKQVFELSTYNLCDQLLQQFHRVDEELSIQGKWQGGSVTGVCRGWGTNKVRSSVNSLGRLGDHWMACTHGALFLCIQFLSLKSMYHIVDTVLSMDPDKNEIAIINVFEEFIGCAVSSLSSSLV
jgi:hypothetical protein